MTDPEPGTLPSGARLGRYQLERRIASGGMADVYLARSLGAFGFVKNVALKVLKRDLAEDRDNVRMFLREATVAAEFRHPNLVQVYEVGEDAGRLYIAMELVRGLSVASLMHALARQGRSIPIPLAARITLEVLDGLGHAHEALGHDGQPLRLVHRDVTPQNILVGTDGVVKVVDFGIARAETAFGRTQAHQIKGKFAYMPPEQWEAGGALDARADLFGLGVVLYEMSTGSGRLFRGDNAPALYQAVVREPIPLPRTRVPDYPDALSDVVMKALARAADDRWSSAGAMRAALAHAMDALGWDVGTDRLAALVDAALEGQSIESRWERIAWGALADLNPDVPTQVDRPGNDPAAEGSSLVSLPTRSERPPPSLRPPPMEPAVGLEPAVGRAVATPAETRRESGRMVAGTLAFVGWALALTAGGLLSQARAENRRVRQDLMAAITQRPPPAPPPVVEVAPLVFLADPALAGDVALPWARSLGTDARVRIDPGRALSRLLLGASDIALVAGLADRAEVATARDQGYDLVSQASAHVVGYDHGVVVVNPANTVTVLTRAQVTDLFTGSVAGWESLTDDRHPRRRRGTVPRVVVCGAGAPTRTLLEDLVLTGGTLSPGADVVADERAAVEAVAADPRAVAVVRLAWVTPAVRAVPVADVQGGSPVMPTRSTVRALTYPLARPVVLYTRGAPIGVAADMVREAWSPAGQSTLEQAGYVSR